MGLKWTRLNPSLLGSCPANKSISPQLICNWKCHSLLIDMVNNFLVVVRSPLLKPEWANGSTTLLCLSDNHHENKVILLLFIASKCRLHFSWTELGLPAACCISYHSDLPQCFVLLVSVELSG